MKSERLLTILATLLLALGLTAAPAFAQSQAINGTIEGTVKDVQGGVLPGVTVTITNTDTGAERVVVTNGEGMFRAPLLPLGTYRVQFAMTSFATRARTGIMLNAGQIAVVNETLSIGGLQEGITVTAEAPVMDAAKTDVGRSLSEVEIKNLPNVARNPYNFALLEPGVTGFENEEFGVPRFAINGQMLRVNFQIDGNTNTQRDRAGLRLMPISEVMIREVQVVSAGYAPEFGQTTGMVFNAVTPSGSNQFRGDVGYRFRTKDFAACPFATTTTCQDNPATKPDNSLKIFTATFGGPIVRSKLFFYGGYEYTRQELPGLVTIDPAVAAAVGLAPQPFSIASYRATPFHVGKVDYQATPSHRLSFRVNTFTNDNPYQNAGNITALERSNDFQDAMISSSVQAISSFGANLLNELRFQVARRETTRPPSVPETTGPSVNITATTGQNNGVQFGPYTGIGNDFIQRNVQLVNNLTVLRGNHSYKLGFDAQWIFDHRGTALPVTYTFPSVQAYLNARSGVNPRGYTTFAQIVGTPDFDMNNATASWFVQDDYRLSSNVKVLYGIRHDLTFYSKGIEGSPYSQTFNLDNNNLAPRVGFAWTLNDRNVIRASSGINYDQPLLAIIERAYVSSGVAARTATVSLNPTSPNAPAFPNNLAAIPANALQASTTIEGMAPNFVTARTWQNNVTWERQLGDAYAFSVGVRHSRGWDLPVINDVNLVGIAPVRTLADGRGVYNATVNASTRVDSRFNRVRLVESVGDSWYKGVTLALNRQYTNGVQFALNYGWGVGEDTAPLGGAVLAIQGDAARADPQTLAIDKGRNQLDITHTFNGSIVAISSVKRFGRLVNAFLSDNQIALILLVNSGQPDGIAGSRDLNNDGVAGDRPLFIARNSMAAPVRKNVDMRYSRFFGLPGNRRFEVQAEAKNIFNFEEVTAVSNTITVDVDGYPVDPTTLVRLPLESISNRAEDYASNGWREQRKFQLGFKFFF
jgi:hypothetical protein